MEKEIYRECQRNHACDIGGYTIDNCIEFIPNNTMKSHCNTCGCHKNYHRKAAFINVEEEPENGSQTGGGSGGKSPFVSLRKVKRTARQQPRVVPPQHLHVVKQNRQENHYKGQRKSKYSQGQREAMRLFSERLGWTLRHKDRQEEIKRFCETIGVSKTLFKTWLNNNKRLQLKRTAISGEAIGLADKMNL